MTHHFFLNMTLLDWCSFFASAVITLECVALLRKPTTWRNFPRDLLVIFTGIAGLASAVSLAEDFHQAHFPGLLLNAGLIYALGYILAISEKRNLGNLPK